MTGQRTPLGRVVGRAALGMLVAAAALGLCAPIATATPESDADDAITAAWEQAGGERSHLGAKQGDVYPVGGGFAQDFANGKMFYTPATGAEAMYGAILDKYESLGGPGGSDLGFPTINEVPGLVGPDSLVTTFSASDKPVIFWTPDHGAFVVRGAINAAWDKLGGSAGVLGVPVGEEAYDGELVTQTFSGGQISWNRSTKVFTTVPPALAEQLAGLQVPIDPTAAINMAWRAAGGAVGPLGAKQGGQHPIGGDGIVQDFAGGKVYFSPATGANAVEGDILAKYESLGGPIGSGLGFPTANETDGGVKPVSRVSTFSAGDKPVIFWTPENGAFVVRGAMKAAWDKLGGATGELGAPVGDQSVDGDVVAQKFTDGTISWNRANNTFSTDPPKLASWLSGLQVPGQKSPSGAAGSGRGTTGHEFGWHGWWLLVVVPVLLLVALVALWGRRRRRRAGPDTSVREAGYRFAGENGYEATPDDERWSWPETDFGRVQLPADRPRPPNRPLSGVSAPGHPAPWMPPGDAAADVADDTGTVGAPPTGGHPDSGADVELEDPDAVDTAPTRVVSWEAAGPGGRHAAVGTPDDAAAYPNAPGPDAPGRLAIHLPLVDPYEAPDGYPVKANTLSGLYYTPDSDLYENTFAEVWFVSEEMARANGFIKAH